MSKQCDGASVGVLVLDAQDRVLVGTRADGAGIAPIAGHVFDAHASYQDAARAEVWEETGMRVTGLTHIGGGHRRNRCRRGDGPNGPGHTWKIYRATATGTPHSADGSMLGLHWATRGELAELAARTVARALGRLTDADWREAPGLEPVWCHWVVLATLIDMNPDDLAAIDELVGTGR